MSFAASINKWVEQAKTDKDTVVTEVFQTITTSIVERTPLGDVTRWKIRPSESQDYRPGALANNWFAGIGSPGSMAIRPPNISAPGSIANIANVEKSVPGQVAYFINPMPYANRIEYAGHSGQRPDGMVRITVAEFQEIVKVAVNGVK